MRDLLQKLNEANMFGPPSDAELKRRKGEMSKKVITAYPYHKRIAVSLEASDKRAMEELVYPEMKESLLAGSLDATKWVSFKPKKRVLITTDSATATFDGIDLFMDLNWEILGEYVVGGEIKVQADFPYKLDQHLIDVLKKSKSMAVFYNETAGVYFDILNIDADDVMQKLYEGPIGKEYFTTYLAEEGIEINPSNLKVVWSVDDHHQYTLK